MTQYKKLLPIVREENRDFWEACKRHELIIQKCISCGTYRFPPRPFCHRCQSAAFELVKVSGKGTIYSFTILNHSDKAPLQAEFLEEAPYAVILVELVDVGTIHLLSNIVECKLEEIRIGMPVEVIFEDVTPEISLPKFRPRR